MPLRLIAALLEATADAHTPRAMVRTIAACLAEHLPLRSVTLDRRVIAERVGDDWVCTEASAAGAEVVPGLAITLALRARMPALFERADFREALAQVVAASLRHLEVVERVAERSRHAHVERRELRADLDRLAATPGVVARSAVMRAVLERAALVARHPTTVLITGESGTGKEVLAKEIHRQSTRAHRPLLHVNCGAIPEALVESELFGHERGAFTGADRAHVGVFERAHRGTLLLDEIGELPPAAQVKLLRVLQERQLRRVGGTATIDVDVRLLAATNRSLPAMVRDGAFREDLYYRLDVFAITVPPLRDRAEDLGPLVARLVNELAARLRIPTPPISRSVMARLAAHDWPGNVRELANVLEGAMILGGARGLELPDHVGRAPRAGDSAAFDAAVRDTIERALRVTRGKLYGPGGAAERLGLHPATLQSKMRKLGIDRAAFVTRT